MKACRRRCVTALLGTVLLGSATASHARDTITWANLHFHPEPANISIEGITPYNVTYVTCVKNEWGKQIVQKVNDILKRYIPTPAHREATLRWYRPAEQIASSSAVSSSAAAHSWTTPVVCDTR